MVSVVLLLRLLEPLRVRVGSHACLQHQVMDVEGKVPPWVDGAGLGELLGP